MKSNPEVNEDALFSLFSRFDTNGDGRIDEAEFRTGLLEEVLDRGVHHRVVAVRHEKAFASGPEGPSSAP